ncbi:MAG: SET domain-containing protein-lysine N-methyltransferase [Rubricoccaceae bacterium]|nr:SET domain-containing protein-lysine N-methyltransferase [Rubricoccaceae bacterium]
MPRPDPRTRRSLEVRRSGIHGKGVYATGPIPAGTRLIEYRGEHISHAEGDRRYPVEEGVPHHTFLFVLDEDTVIDGARGGNLSRWINHSCDPNCESVWEDGHVYVDAVRDLAPGEELTMDYHLVAEEPHTAALAREYPCRCGAPACRGTLLGENR